MVLLPVWNSNMNLKERLNHKIYIQVLRQMSPEKRLLKAFELSEFTRQLFIHGLRRRFPQLSGGSEKQFTDALRVYEVQFEKLDMNYMEYWAKKLDVEPIWKRLKDKAE